MRGVTRRWTVAGGVLTAVTGGCGGETGQVGLVRSEPPGSSKDCGSAGSDGGDAGNVVTRLTVQPYPPDYPQVRDEKKAVDCTPTLASDGVERCLPSGGGVLFTDPNCTHAVVAVAPDLCGKAPAYFTHAGGLAGCLVPKATTYTAGAPIDPPETLYYHSLGQCVEMNHVAARIRTISAAARRSPPPARPAT